MHLAEKLRAAGIKVGDVVELVSAPDWVSEAMHARINEGEEWKGEEQAQMEGLLVEVTAIGERNILCFWLHGEPIAEGETGLTYALYKWPRNEGARESVEGGDKAFRLVYRDGHCLLPNVMNVYSRCQS